MKTVAVVLAAGSGKRMNTSIKKQYLELESKPVLYYSLKAFEDSFIDSITLVTSKEEVEFCKKEIVEKYCFKKVDHIVTGGKERYHSVMNGLFESEMCDYIFIHDGARPFITGDLLQRLFDTVIDTKACVAAVPVKDTVKIADNSGYVINTPNRKCVWSIQTPQVFSYSLIRDAYAKLREKEGEMEYAGIQITDDAMVVETFTSHKIKLVEGSYRNIKITTPEDLVIAKKFAKEIVK